MEFLQSLIFYKWQILQAIMLGVLLSASGTLVVLRREAVFGLLATQAAVLARIAIHMLGISYMDNYVSMLVSLFLCAPFYFLARRAEHASAILLGGVLCFSAAAELLAALGHFRMHLLQSYFGNFLISEPQSLWITLFAPGCRPALLSKNIIYQFESGAGLCYAFAGSFDRTGLFLYTGFDL